jgi:hypothetical protein
LTSHILYVSLIARAIINNSGSGSGGLQPRAMKRQKGGRTMNNLDRFFEYLVAGVFLCVGLAKILSFRRRPKPLGAQSSNLPFGMSYKWLAAVGLFQIVAALVLVAPLSFSSVIAPWAVAGLAWVTLSGAMVHMRRHESAVPNVALFLLVMLVVVGRWM